MKWTFPLVVSLLWIAGIHGCARTSADTDFLYSTMTELTVEVAYEPGAEPYVDNLPNTQNVWTILEQNLNSLFTGRAKVPAVTVPKTLASMTALTAQNKTTWTNDDIAALAKASRKGVPTSTHGYFFVAFLKGNLDKNGAADTGVLGVSLTGTTVIAIFKDVIVASGGGPVVARLVEQATLVHETGHALGLVNNGVPMQQAHQDSAHGAHCDNPNCVLYYQNDGVTSAVAFVQKYLTTSNYVMYDTNCLNDTRKYQVK